MSTETKKLEYSHQLSTNLFWHGGQYLHDTLSQEGPMNWKLISLVIPSIFVLIAGCSSHSRTSSPATAASLQHRHEVDMRSSWVGKSYSELAKAKGSNGTQMNIPGTGNSTNFVVLYDTDPASGCIDAFTVAKGEAAIIQDYFCR